MLMYEVELQIIDKEVIRSFPRTADPSVVVYCGFTRSKHTGIVFLAHRQGVAIGGGLNSGNLCQGAFFMRDGYICEDLLWGMIKNIFPRS